MLSCPLIYAVLTMSIRLRSASLQLLLVCNLLARVGRVYRAVRQSGSHRRALGLIRQVRILTGAREAEQMTKQLVPPVEPEGVNTQKPFHSLTRLACQERS